MKAHQLRSYRAPHAPQCRPAITGEQGQTIYNKRGFCHPIGDAEKLPDRGTAEIVILFSIRKARCSTAPSRCAQCSIVMKPLLRKGSCLPSFHPRRGDRDPVNSSSAVRNITADLLETSISEKLTSPRNMILTFETVPCGVVAAFYKWGSSHAELRVFGKFPHQKR